jgi:RNA polymerase sigma factor (sigma-70 family)
MEVSALKPPLVATRHGRSPLLRLQSDERLIALIRRGNHAAFEALVSRYQSRLLAFCRHMLGSREDAEDVLQEVFAAAFSAIQADERPLNVRPWLYRIARNRSLNHLRRAQAIGVDSMDIHLSENGQTTADKVHKREEFRLLMEDVWLLPETQRTALLLREMEALSYDQISEAMETTVPSVKSLLVRARVSLAEAAEARMLSCEAVRIELGEVAEGIRRRLDPPVRRHLRNCDRCATFRGQLKQTNRALAAVFPVGPLLLLKKLALAHFGTTASAGAGAGGGATAAGGAAGGAATTATGAAAGTAASTAAGTAGSAAAGAATASTVAAGGAAAGGAAAGGAAAGSAAGSLLSAGASAVASKAAAGVAAAALVTAGAVEVQHVTAKHAKHAPAVTAPRVAVKAEKTAHEAAEPTPEPKDPTATAHQAGKGTAAKAGDANHLQQGDPQPGQAQQGQAQGGHAAQGQAPGQPTATTAVGDPTRVETKSDTTTLPGPAPTPDTHFPSSPPAQAPPSPGTGDAAPPAPASQPVPAATPGGMPAP